MNYIVLSKLGQGGMASVWLAKHKSLDAEFAIKILDKRFISDDNIRKRFLSEARIMSRMNHPNVVKVIDLIDEPQSVAFVMEHIPGETLKQHIDRIGKLDEEAVKMIFSQMLAATKYIHDQGLIHRDIKPSNFMLTPDGVVKLMDFGIAKVSDATSSEYTGTGTSQQMGTPMYMSPEQVRSTKSVTAATDTYSLGVTLWHMVSGTKPYDTASLSLPEIQVAILRDDLPMTGTIWDSVIQKATKKKLEDRFKSDVEFLEAVTEPLSSQINASEHTTEPLDQEKQKSKIKSNKPDKKLPIAIFVIIALIAFGIFNDKKDSDNDGVEDKNDACPSIFGIARLNGCPDSDNDRISDADDLCPDLFGIAPLNGCPDGDGDGIADKDDDCPESRGNESNGCFYYKSVTFTNNSSYQVKICVAYKHNEAWICTGWWDVEKKDGYTVELPSRFKGMEVYWTATSYGGAIDWEGSDRYFNVQFDGTSGFATNNDVLVVDGGGRMAMRGFHNLILNNENTFQIIVN